MANKLFRTFLTLGCFTIVLVLYSQQPALAQTTPNDNIKMQAHPGFEGKFKYGEWLPIWVTLENTNADIETTLKAQINQSGGNITFARRVSLPYNSRKQVVLYVLPNNFSREIEIQLIAENDLLASQVVEVSPIQTDNYLVGIAASERGPLAQISSIKFEQSPREIVLTELELDKIPDQPVGLNSFDVIILNDIDTSGLSEAQQKTLERWVENGGFLVIGGGSSIAKTTFGLPDSLVNYEFMELVESSSLPALEQLGGGEEILLNGPFLISTIKDHDTQNSNSDDIAILHQWRVGRGTISLVTLSLTDTPFNAWSGTPEFWKNLLAEDAYFPNYQPRDLSERQMHSNNMTYPLSNLPALDLPSIKWLGILLIVYIIAIGPANYLLLKQKKRLHLAWITIPVLTAVFTAGAFSLAYAMRGNDIVTNMLAIVNLNQDGNARITSYIGMFSPAQESYEIQVSGDLLMSPTIPTYYDPWSSYSPVSAVGETVFLQGDPSKVIGLEINQWSMQSFMVENLTTYFGKIDSDLTLSGDQLIGNIQNQMDLPLKDTVIVFGNSVIPLGDLAPQETKSVETAVTEQPTEFYGGTLSYRILETFYPNAGFEYQRDYDLRLSILNATFQPFGFWTGPSLEIGSAPEGDALALSSIYLVGWVEEAPLDIQVNGSHTAQNTLGMLTTNLPLQLASGEYSFPTTLLEGRLVNQSLESGYCGGTATSIYMEYGTKEFEFQIPATLLETDIDQLIIRFEDETTQWNSGGTNISLSIFDWKKNRWSGISQLEDGITSIEDADSFIDPDGSVRIELEKELPNSGGCVLVLVGIEGTKP